MASLISDKDYAEYLEQLSKTRREDIEEHGAYEVATEVVGDEISSATVLAHGKAALTPEDEIEDRVHEARLVVAESLEERV